MWILLNMKSYITSPDSMQMQLRLEDEFILLSLHDTTPQLICFVKNNKKVLFFMFGITFLCLLIKPIIGILLNIQQKSALREDLAIHFNTSISLLLKLLITTFGVATFTYCIIVLMFALFIFLLFLLSSLLVQPYPFIHLFHYY